MKKIIWLCLFIPFVDLAQKPIIKIKSGVNRQHKVDKI